MTTVVSSKCLFTQSDLAFVYSIGDNAKEPGQFKKYTSCCSIFALTLFSTIINIRRPFDIESMAILLDVTQEQTYKALDELLTNRLLTIQKVGE